jgi:hypothetical protein
MNIIRLFSKAGATGHVFTITKGKINNRGLAYSGFLFPWTTVAVVPTTTQIMSFSLEALTKDKQVVIVKGSLTATLDPIKAVSKLDFTVNPSTGSYTSQWQQILNARIMELILRAVLGTVKDLAITDAISSQGDIENAVLKQFGSSDLSSDGINVTSCSVPKIDPGDDEVHDAIGAAERELMLTKADLARHERQMTASKNDRGIKTYEAETKLELEKKRAELLKEENVNKETEANGDAKATVIRFEALKDIVPGKIFGAALLDMAKMGVGSLTITNELLTALGGGNKSEQG